MGIRRLTGYINSNVYLKPYELHDTYLVIDGDNISCQLYFQYGNNNCVFGGDYDEYAQLVSNFFDDLLKCNVTPLVLFDGGWETKKLKTIISRMKEKIQTASTCTPVSQYKIKFLPVLLKRVFTQILQEKNIRYVQCIFEADSAIAAVAKTMDCPVLSFDSDFYIYGTLYIPFTTLNMVVNRSSTRNGHSMNCEIYQVECLLNYFPGLTHSILPLAAVLLGNDYTEHNAFQNFFHYLKSFQDTMTWKPECRIHAVFTWLSKYNLSEAIVQILSRVLPSMRQEALDIIEININSYANTPVETLISQLGVSEAIVTPLDKESFKFNMNINKLKYIKEKQIRKQIETNYSKEMKDQIQNIYNQLNVDSNDGALDTLPEWFMNDLYKAKYSGSVINLIIKHIYISPILVEDDNYPSSTTIGLKLLSVLFGILNLEMNDNNIFMKYVVRDTNKGIAVYKLQGAKVPSFLNLRNISLTDQREILDKTLGITNKECINNLLPEWKLYVCCIKYWIEQREQYKTHKCFIYSVLICLFFDIIDSKIGRHRVLRNFKDENNKIIEIIQKRRITTNYEPYYLMDSTIAGAYNDINKDDCLLAAAFFVHQFEMQQKLYTNPEKFDRSIVHAFAELQICLMFCSNLNVLLGSPYPVMKIPKLLNCTFLYNLCDTFRSCKNIEGYANRIFQDSPSLSRLFKTLLSTIRPLFPSLLQ